jgi:TonB family protein
MPLKEYRRTIGLGILFVCFIIFLFSIGLKFLVQQSVVLISPELERKLGEEIFDAFIKDQNINQHEPTLQILNKCNHMGEYFNAANMVEIEIVIVENDSIKNAFALPGGYIIIYRGILNMLDNENELMALIAHEVGHIHLRHGLRRIIRQAYTRFIIASFFGNSQDISKILVDNSSTLLNLAYDRDEEEAADVFALNALKRMDLNTEGLLTLFQKLQEVESEQKIPTFLSTHPATASRIKFIQQQIEEDANYNSVLTEEEWEGLVLNNESTQAPLMEETEPDYDRLVDKLSQSTMEADSLIMPFFSLTDKPKVIKQVSPIYPELAREAGIEGRVVLKILIDTSGNVEKWEVVKGHPLLVDPSIEAARNWKFKPGMINSRAVKVWMNIPIDFKLRK